MDSYDGWPWQMTTTDNHNRQPQQMTDNIQPQQTTMTGGHTWWQQDNTDNNNQPPSPSTNPSLWAHQQLAQHPAGWQQQCDHWPCGKPPPPPNLFAPLHQVHSQQGCSLPPPHPLQLKTWRHIHPCKCRKSTLNNMKLSLSLPPSECFLSFVSYSLHVLCTTN